MSQHGFNEFDASERSGADLPAILDALQTSHLGVARPGYAKAGMFWAKEVRSGSTVVGADLFFDDGSAGIPLGRFNYSSNQFTLYSTILANSGVRNAAYRYVGTNTGNLVEVLSGKRLPALDASLLTGLGTAAKLNTGTAVGQIIVVQPGGKLPPLDGSDLTGVGAGILTSENALDVSTQLPLTVGAGNLSLDGADLYDQAVSLSYTDHTQFQLARTITFTHLNGVVRLVLRLRAQILNLSGLDVYARIKLNDVVIDDTIWTAKGTSKDHTRDLSISPGDVVKIYIRGANGTYARAWLDAVWIRANKAFQNIAFKELVTE